MNKIAKEIGMVNTTFQNAHGLDEETKNYSTAHEYGSFNLVKFIKISKNIELSLRLISIKVQTEEKSSSLV